MSFSAEKTFHRFFPIFLLGFSSGLPIALVGSTLQAWLTESGASLFLIGWVTLIGQPYSYKFLWAPLLDYFCPQVAVKLLDHRRFWILLTQCFLIVLLAGMGLIGHIHSNQISHPHLLIILALWIAIFSATQDTAYDAYRTDILLPKERGLGATMMILGYRVAMLTSGALALIFAQYYGWRVVYLCMAGLLLIGIIGTCWAPKLAHRMQAPSSLSAAFKEPIQEFFSRPSVWMIILLILLYKIGDAFTLSLSSTFLLRGLHFTLVDVGTVHKIGGLLATLLGGLLAGFIMLRVSLFRSLWYFGLFQSVAILSYMLLAMIGKNYVMLTIAIVLQQLSSGMGTVAFLALLTALCDHRYSAAQFAFFSAIDSLGRVYVGPVASLLVVHIGWAHFYFIAFWISFSGLFVLWKLREHIVFR